MAKIIIIPPKNIEEMKKDLYKKIHIIDKRKEKADIDYLRIELERLVKLCKEIIYEKQKENRFI